MYDGTKAGSHILLGGRWFVGVYDASTDVFSHFSPPPPPPPPRFFLLLLRLMTVSGAGEFNARC